MTPSQEQEKQISAAELEAALSETPMEALSQTPPPNEKRVLRLAVIGDMNGRYGSSEYGSEVTKAIDMIIADRPDIVINVGDMVAGQKAKLKYRAMWQAFHSVVTDRLNTAQIPMAQVVGNHDGSPYPPYVTEREIYIDEWLARKPELDYVDDAAYPLYYSFKKNDVLFIALDIAGLDPLDELQYTWLEQQLAENPSPYPPIVFGHVPLFAVSSIKPTEHVRDARLHPLFSKYGVQLFLSGHQHAYYPAKLDGVTYLLAGALGGGPRSVRQNGGIDPKTLSFVDIYPQSQPYLETYLLADNNAKRFNHNVLPTYIVLRDQILPRADISLDDAQFAHDFLISPHMTKSQLQTLIEVLRASDGDWSRTPDWMPGN